MADAWIEHPLVPPATVARRDYQVAIAHEALKRNTLVILPTGMGKTVIALLVAADRLLRGKGKVLFLAPTKPLVEQHARYFAEHLVGARVATFTGESPPEERELEWRSSTVVCSTPQVIQNDVVSGRIDLQDATLVLVDEAHRAVGNYAYVFLADAYRRQSTGGLLVALTASPGAKADKITEICENLGIEGVEVRTEADADTAPYVQDTDVEWKVVAVPESLKLVAATLRAMFDERVAVLRATGALPAHVRFATRKALLDAAAVLQARIRSGEADANVYQALSAQAAALKIGHALELAETQGVGALASYLERLTSDESKAAKSLVADARMGDIVQAIATSRVDHPKIRQVAILVRQQLKEKPDARIIVFTNYRDTSEMLTEQLKAVEGVRPARFVGQASRSESDRGMSQKKQVEMVEAFKAGTHNVLIATSVAEEGLDIPQTDLVVFYEPVASEIRAIQRRGRTGRKRAGRVVILITKDTRDETYHWASRGREQKMRKEIDALKKHFAHVNASESSPEWRAAFAGAAGARVERPLSEFATASPEPEAEAKVTIIADHREFSSAVVRELSKLGAIVRGETLEVADYVLSDRVAVERKEASDFATSLIDGRLFPQAKALRDSYSAPLVVVEGEGMTTARRISEDALWSALASLATDFHLSIVFTKDASETARFLHAVARREQRREERPLAIRAEKRAMSDDERLRFLVEGLPNVSAVLARRLLERFGTVKGIVDASVDELAKVDGIGKVTAQAIHDVVRTQFVGRRERP